MWIRKRAALSPVDPASVINASTVSALVSIAPVEIADPLATLAIAPLAAELMNGVIPAANTLASTKQSTSPPVIPISRVTCELPLASRTSRHPPTIIVSAGMSSNSMTSAPAPPSTVSQTLEVLT